jgi:hypothetical protein
VANVPDWNPDFKGQVISGAVDRWFDPNAYKMPIAGPFGNVSQGSLRGPGLFDVDTSLFKKIKVSERWNVQLRAEAFNILNRPNFAYPNQIVFQGNSASYAFSPSAGTITSSATSTRQLQLALKLPF